MPLPLKGVCPYCLREFEKTDVRQKYCSPEHRTLAGNERNRSARGPIKRRGPRTVYSKETHCLWCGKELLTSQQRFCCLDHAYSWWNEKKKEEGGRRGDTYHRIRDIEPELKRGTCSICGPGTPLQSLGKSGWACKSRYQTERHKRNQRRAGWLKRGIDLSLEDHDAMLDVQKGKCAICRAVFGARSGHVDHCHDSKIVRGLLCDACNLGLGKFKHHPVFLRAAADYLEAFATFQSNESVRCERLEILGSLTGAEAADR